MTTDFYSPGEVELCSRDRFSLCNARSYLTMSAGEISEMHVGATLYRYGRKIVVVEKSKPIHREVEGDAKGMKIFLREDIGRSVDLSRILFRRVICLELVAEEILMEDELTKDDDKAEMAGYMNWALDHLVERDFGIREMFEETYRFKFSSLIAGWFIHPKHTHDPAAHTL